MWIKFDICKEYKYTIVGLKKKSKASYILHLEFCWKIRSVILQKYFLFKIDDLNIMAMQIVFLPVLQIVCFFLYDLFPEFSQKEILVYLNLIEIA